MCSGSEAGSYLRLIDFVYHSTLGWRVIKKKELTPHATQVPWGDLRYIFGDIMYGGHITDPYDRILCRQHPPLSLTPHPTPHCHTPRPPRPTLPRADSTRDLSQGSAPERRGI